ncbi:extracellular solute-binding protein [Actinoallomurus acaciae]|uniref:Probable sugar-binding periplasmic protein n=1 Tax=Actinoallomurus acaciae TaxID=502577 RepID=A0ABV5YJG0_9ACTN
MSLWTWRTDDKAAMQQIFAGFEAKNPGVKVKLNFIPDADYQNRLGVALRGGKGPDIAQLKAYGELQPLVNAGYLKPLDDKVPELKQLSPSALEGAKAKKDGKYYGVPYSTVNMGVYYNKALFAKAGLSVPKTYAEFLKDCQKLKAAGVTPIAAGGADGTGWAMEINTGVMGPGIYGPDFYQEMMTGKAKFTDPRFVKVLQRVKDLAPYYEDGFSGTDYTAAVQQFVTGKAAMFFGGSYENGSFKAQNPNLKFSIFPFPPDQAGGTAYTSSFSDGSYGLVSTSKHETAALKVLRFIGSADFAKEFADRLGWPPARDGVTPSDPVLKEMVAMQAHSMPYVTLVGFRWQTPTASSILQAGIVDVVTGRKTPQALAAEMDKGVSAWFKPTP